MTQEITRWVTEIRTLQQQLAAIRQERDQAYKSAANWRQRYDAEAKQRREDVEQLQLTVKTLRTELATLQAPQKDSVSAELLTHPLEEDADASLDTVEGLRTQLVKALQQCDRLQKGLDAERADHAETRKSLTTALGEAIDALSPEPEKAALVRRDAGGKLKKSTEE
ncbi:MAG: hypothetical protein AAGE59_12330 [Cyanobacteria bacterium P01_F01_bin.86]